MKRFFEVSVLLALALVVGGTAWSQDDRSARQDTGGEGEDHFVYEPPGGGIEIVAFLEAVSRAAGISIVYDPQDPRFTRQKLDLTSRQQVPRDRVLDWARSILMSQKIVLVRTGSVGDTLFTAVDDSHPAATSRPEFLSERELAQLSTRGVGRLNDVPSEQALIAADYAPVVWSMKKIVAEMDHAAAEARGMAVAVEEEAAPVEIHNRIENYEHMLVGSRTETAAKYFSARISQLRSEHGIR